MEASCAGVAPTLIADGGRVPCAGDSEPSDENVRSPNPLVSPSAATSSGAGITREGDFFRAVVLVLLVVRAVRDASDAGVRFLVEGRGTS
jgi:hypothetical protein